MSLVAKISENVHVGAREYLTFRLDQEEYGIDMALLHKASPLSW